VLLQPDVIAAAFALSPCDAARVLAGSGGDASGVGRHGVTSMPAPAMAVA
jgi:hypothetical protein